MYLSYNVIPTCNYNNLPNNLHFGMKNYPVNKNTVSFKQAEVPPEVIAYLRKQKINLIKEFKNHKLYKFKWFREGWSIDLNQFDPQKLEGIQKGIKIFRGLSFAQIKYMILNLRQIIVQRGCNNRCIHCYAEAETPYFMKKNNFTDKIAFEDYQNIINGFKKLNKRLGFNPFDSSFKPMGLFNDSDCSMIYLQDKKGKMFDYADLSKMLYDVTHQTVLFDTAGWNVSDIKTQKRMDDLVQKIVKSEKYNFLQFWISINPFHSIYSKAIELEKKGDIEKSKKLRKIYIDRIANVIFTFSPLIGRKTADNNYPMLDFIIRSLKDGKSPELIGYTQHDTKQICSEILEKLEELYTKDLTSSSPKIVKQESQKKKYLDYIQGEFSNTYQDITITNKRLSELLDAETLREYSSKMKTRLHNSAEKAKSIDGGGVLDVNGKFYISNDVETYPTNISLNYSSKDKPTAPMEPNLRAEIIKI